MFREITISHLKGDISIPEKAKAIVIFAHGSGSSRKSPRNLAVAKTFNDHGFATLLMDLLTVQEDEKDMITTEHRFNIPLLAERVIHAADWVRKHDETRELPVALFGASTGAAAALVAAAKMKEPPFAIISRGGRPDLAKSHLKEVRSPTILIVGSNDPIVIELNEQAQNQMTCVTDLVLIEGATHLFEERGTLEEVSKQALAWLEIHLPKRRQMAA